MTEAMRSAVRASGPRLQVSKMTPRPIDLRIIGDDEGEDEAESGTSVFMRYATLLVIVVGVLWFVYWLTTK